MHIGMVGLGRMGGNMRARIEAAGHTVTGYDTDPAISDVPTLADLAAAMTAGQRVVWIMVPGVGFFCLRLPQNRTPSRGLHRAPLGDLFLDLEQVHRLSPSCGSL